MRPIFFFLSSCFVLLSVACATQNANKANAPSNSDWPSYGLDLANHRYSPLTQINRDTVKQLQPAWTYNSGVKATFQATPIVVGGAMYVALPFNHVVALDARTGVEKWRYTHALRKGYKLCCGPANRGVAVGNGMVFIGTVDARLIALDAATGKPRWDIDVTSNAELPIENVAMLNKNDPLSRVGVTGSTGVGINMAPIVFDGKVIVGITGVGYGLHLDSPRKDAPLGAVVGVQGEYGRPGFLAAYDVNSGKQIWQFDTIAAQNWEGQFAEKSPDGTPLNRDIALEKSTLKNFPNAARFGGGSAWSTPAIDRERNLLFFGTGNPSPQMDDVSRPGDNLYSVSLVALDLSTGKRHWHFQQVPHDVWGYDVASPPVLIDVQYRGKSVPAVVQASKTGWVFVNHRDTGELLLKSDPVIPQFNLFARATKQGTRIYPGAVGGTNWSPIAVNEAKLHAFVASMHMPMKYTLNETPGDDGKPPLRYSAFEPTEEPRWGLLSSVDLTSGKLRWQHKTAQPLIGGVLATAGGLVFTGEGNGDLTALDAETGTVVWQNKGGANAYGVNAPPITYAIDGVQYIAVVAGGNSLFGYAQGDAVKVFRLKGGEK